MVHKHESFTGSPWRSTMTEQAPPTLRERKKRKLRQQMIEVSQRLFAQQGYGATTLEQICQEIDIRPQTLLRYFESKVHLALAETLDALDEFRRSVERPDRSERVLDLWREAVVTHATPHTVELSRWVLAERELVAMFASVQSDYEAVLAAGLAADDGVDPDDDVYCHLFAAALVSGSAALFRRWLKGLGHPNLAEDQQVVIDWIESQFSAKRRQALTAVIAR